MSGVCVGGGRGKVVGGGRRGRGSERGRTENLPVFVPACPGQNFPSGWLGGSAVVLLASGDGTMDEWMGADGR